MNNKTKNKLKRVALICVISALLLAILAVPAFAVDSVVWRSVDTSFTVEPVTITKWQNGAVFPEIDTTGMYAIVFDDLASDIQDAAPSASGFDIFPGFTGVGYLEVAYNGGARVYYAFGADMDTDADDIEVYISLDVEVMKGCLRINTFNASTLDVFVNNAVCTFYFDRYPPVDITASDASATYFWNDYATYNVGIVSSTSPDPEPPAGGDDGGEGDTSGIFAVWSAITQWATQGLASASNAFYFNGELTLLGYLAIIPLGIGLAFLLVAIIQKFLRLRG